MGGAARYRSVLRRPHVARVAGSAQVARRAMGIYRLALILFVRHLRRRGRRHGSVRPRQRRRSPWKGRLIDRHVAFVCSEASRRWEPHPERPQLGPWGALRSTGMQTLAATAVPASVCVGMIEVTIPAFADAVGSRAQAGLLLSVWWLASAAGGLV